MISYKTKPNTEKQLKKILHPLVSKWFFHRFKSFSQPQLFGVMEIHSRNNILVSAPTGATKTLTGFLSILNELVDSSLKGILEDRTYCIYISPLKALSNDIYKNLIEPLQEMEVLHGSPLGIRVGVRTGDTTQYERSKMTKIPPHILITTPESLAILINSPKFKFHISHVDWCIIDEIHALAENKRGVHLSLSMERLQRFSPALCRVGLSATVSPLEDVASFLVGSERSCKIIDVQFIKQTDLQVMSPVPNLIDTDYEELNKKTYELIDKLIHEHKTTLIFTNTRSGTERVVHHLKQKFPNKYYEIEEGPPTKISSLIGAHHGSLSKTHRFKIEESLRQGKLKAVVCSTSLELGIDIGYVDLVICLGSPKSVARFLQRAGRAGHKLHETVKGRLIVMNRDDLIECSVLLKNALEKKIDRLHIPTNCLDVLAQQIYGIAINQIIEIKELYKLIKQSYCYKDLTRKDFDEVIDYLAGEFSKLEDRNIYAKIWHEDGRIGKRGRLARVIYMTNIGTIPDQHGVTIKIGTQMIGTIDEGFLERLKKGDIFVLGGDTYIFKYAKGMVAQVMSALGKKPTVPSWFSEMLPLSFDLGVAISRFKYLVQDKFNNDVSKEDILKFINKHLYVDDNAAIAIYNYMKEQYDYIGIPNLRWMIVEKYNDGKKTYYIFHSNFGRRVNDALSRAVAYAISRTQHRDVEIGMSDNGFYVGCAKPINAVKAFELLKADELKQILIKALDGSEVLKRRFRHCAGRALMILRIYKGRKKHVGRQQVSSMILLNAVKRISEDFCILKEAKREVLEDLMDIANAIQVLKWVENKTLKVHLIDSKVPSPFAFNLIVQGYSDILKAGDKLEFLKRMHQMVRAKIELDRGKKK
ncbi:MAG: ATP-dependent helicase [Nanoarchaeota archaeon]|nr:ATP-dependent helicase [Nanoarchaeota archaeon]